MNDTTLDGGRAAELAAHWIDCWNRRDLDGVLGHWREDASFTSPYVVDFVGRPSLQGKAELASYWRTGLDRIPDLHFELQDVCWDPVRRILTILYLQTANGHTRHACEIMHLDEAGVGIRGNAMYGAPAASGSGAGKAAA